ncbi:hypothetical protein ACEWY4_014125 [Coilia grayii]|uniref:Reelin domain-containing protein n=1 Tax=Coilia grayii TaxID=363190 RepID=A0ABD1JRE9_9TELE
MSIPGLILSFLLLGKVSSYSDGELLKRYCKSMEVNHAFQTEQEGVGPFIVTVLHEGEALNPQRFHLTKDDVVEVDLVSTSTGFQGFMINMQNDEGHPVGSFSTPNNSSIVLLQCQGSSNTLTHRDNQQKSSISGQWKAPSTANYSVRAVVVGEEHYWNFKIVPPTTTPATTNMPTTGSPSPQAPAPSALPTAPVLMSTSPINEPSSTTATTNTPMSSHSATTINSTTEPTTSGPRLKTASMKGKASTTVLQVSKLGAAIPLGITSLLDWQPSSLKCYQAWSVVYFCASSVAFGLVLSEGYRVVAAFTGVVAVVSLLHIISSCYLPCPSHELRNFMIWVLRFLVSLQTVFTVLAIFAFLEPYDKWLQYVMAASTICILFFVICVVIYDCYTKCCLGWEVCSQKSCFHIHKLILICSTVVNMLLTVALFVGLFVS